MVFAGEVWTHVQPIRTYAEMLIEFKTPLPEPFTYQELKNEAVLLSKQGLSYARIAKMLGVTDKTAKKAIVRG